MKKYLLIIAVVAFAFAACKPQPKPEKEVTFQISVTDITASTASVNVIPSDTNVMYYYDVMTVAYYDELGSDEAVYADLKEYWDEVIAYYKEMGETLTLEEFMSKGEDGWNYSGLTSNTQFYAFAFAVDSTYALKGKITKVNFATEEVQNVNLLFEPALTDTAIWFLPNNEDIDYFPFVIDVDSLNGYTLAEYYDLYAEYIESMYGAYFEYFLMSGPVYVSYDGLEAGHNYYFAAKAYTDGIWNSDLFQTQFAGPAAATAAPAKIEKGGFNQQARMKKAKKIQKVNSDFKAEKMAK